MRRTVVAGAAAAWATSAAGSRERPMITPFEIPPCAAAVRDLRDRLRRTRWADAVTRDWSYGTERGFLEALVDNWANDYDWERRRVSLGQLPHFMADLDGYRLHFLRFRGEGEQPIPLLLMNGWPSSFVEFQRLAPRLARGRPAFEVIVPTHPGFGFSERPTRPYQLEPADLYPRLMRALGHERFMVAGTDIGAGIATRIALGHPDQVSAVHVSAVAEKPRAPGAPPPTDEEMDYDRRSRAWQATEGGYQAIQTTRPQTLAFGLADSPAGMASWIVEKFRGWTDCDGDVLSVWPRETLLDNLMVYWLTGCIASSIRYYREASTLRPKLQAADQVRAPTAVAMWPQDLLLTPRSIAERLYNVRRYRLMPRGGHFPAWEAPDLYAEDLRELARLRA